MADTYPDAQTIAGDLHFKHLDSNLHCFDELESTMERAWERARNEEGETALGQVIVADHQTKGRGRHGSTWFSPAGSGLYLSILLKSKISEHNLYPHLTVVGSLAVVRMVQKAADFTPRIRWPNDVVYEKKEGDVQKFAGVLVESKKVGNSDRPRVVIGTGVNVNIPESSFPEKIRDEATSLQAITGDTFDRTSLLRSYLQAFDDLLSKLYRDKMAEINDEWTRHSAVTGRRVTLRVEGEPIEGTVEDISLTRGLTLRLDQGGYRILEPSHVTHLRLKSDS